MSYWAEEGSNVLWMYGGRRDDGFVLSEVYSCDVNTRNWEVRTTTGGGPGPRFGATTWYKSSTRQLYLYGGKGSTSGEPQSDLWVLQLSNLQWTQISTNSTPGPVDDGAAAIGANENTAYMFGGEGLAGSINPSTLWSFDTVSNVWTAISPSTAPSPRQDHRMFYDDASNSVFVIGGQGVSNQVNNEVWVYSTTSGTWSQSLDIEVPSARQGAALCKNDNGVPFLFGGSSQNGLLNDLWNYGVKSEVGTSNNPTTTNNYNNIFLADSDKIYSASVAAAVLSGLCLLFVGILGALVIYKIVLRPVDKV